MYPLVRRLPALLLLLAAAGCRPSAPETSSAPALTNRADSLAWTAYEAMGGPEVWEHLPAVRFDFAAQAEGEPPPTNRRRHLWNRTTGDYRLETVRGDSVYVVLFNTQTRTGQVFASASRADTAAVTTVDEPQRQGWLDRAYRAFINDMYWLLQPTKLFDPGVSRLLEPDSAANGQTVVRLSFEGVGLTPGDRYWLYFAPGQALPAAWRFHLQGDSTAGPLIRSEGDTVLVTPYGNATLRTRHRVGTSRTVLTDHVALPDSVAAAFFTDPKRWLAD